jgi:hypothetical protein
LKIDSRLISVHLKKIISIALLLIFLFNLGGYYLIYWGLAYHAGIEMDKRLEANNYSPEETVTFKIPIALPYYFDWKDYERMEGSYEENGEFFKLVKQKFEGDTLYIVGIKDHQKKRLVNAMADFVKLSTDLPASSQHAGKLLSSLIKDYAPSVVTKPLIQQGWSRDCTFVEKFFTLLTQDIPLFLPPPKLIS